MMQIILILVFVTLGLLLYFYQQKIKQKELEKIKILELIKIRAEEEQKRIDEEKRKAKEEWGKFITGRKEPIKLSFYDTRHLDYKMTNLYEKIVHDNLWINEPFHTKFYEFLMLINDNNFMIIDPYSKAITMNIRDKHNKVQTSKSYQVYSTKDIIKHMVSYCMDDITGFNKNDAQSLVISIFIVALKQSVHYLSYEVPQNIIDKMLKDYEEAPRVRNIVHMVETKKEKVYFIQEALHDAFYVVETFPYNDSEVPKALEIRKELPKKLLKTV